MSFLTNTWRQLVRRRLWPVALLLVAAIAAVPLVVAKEPTVAVETAAPAAPAAASSELTEAPIVEASTAPQRAAGRKLLGKQRDIFKSTAKKPKAPKVVKTEKADKTEQAQDPEKPATESPSGGGITSPPSPVTTTPAPKPKTYALYSLAVRFGSTDSDIKKRTLPRMKALPSSEQPLLIYLGLLPDNKTAVFLLDASAKAQGDGECHPTPESCETIRLQAGETEFIDVVDESGATSAQFQLDLLTIHKSTTSDPAKAARASKLAKVAGVGTDRVGAAVRGLGLAAARTR